MEDNQRTVPRNEPRFKDNVPIPSLTTTPGYGSVNQPKEPPTVLRALNPIPLTHPLNTKTHRNNNHNRTHDPLDG